MVELRLLAPERLVEAASDALLQELGALAVTVADADAGSADEAPIFGEPGLPPPLGAWRHSLVSALYDDEASATDAVTLLLAQAWAVGIVAGEVRAVPDQDWVRITQAQFGPVEITPSFWIVPTWHAPPVPTARNLRLDPGLAFGTGTHATTRMCLRWIASHGGAGRPPWRRVLDYGCGSGILAIAAASFGARDVDAVDIDRAAVVATRANAEANGVVVRAGLPDAVSGHYDLVVANILAAPLTLLAPLLCSLLAPGGSLLLAGLLTRQVEQLRLAYAPWCHIDAAAEDEGWALMVGRRADGVTDAAARDGPAMRAAVASR